MRQIFVTGLAMAVVAVSAVSFGRDESGALAMRTADGLERLGFGACRAEAAVSGPPVLDHRTDRIRCARGARVLVTRLSRTQEVVALDVAFQAGVRRATVKALQGEVVGAVERAYHLQCSKDGSSSTQRFFRCEQPTAKGRGERRFVVTPASNGDLHGTVLPVQGALADGR